MKWRVKSNTRHFRFAKWWVLGFTHHFRFAKWWVLGFTHHFTLYCINLTIFLHFCTFQQCISCEIGILSMMFYSSSHSSTTRDFWWVKHHTEIASSQDIYITWNGVKQRLGVFSLKLTSWSVNSVIKTTVTTTFISTLSNTSRYRFTAFISNIIRITFRGLSII